MAVTQSSQIIMKIAALLQSVGALATAQDNLAVDYTISIGNGTGLNQAADVWQSPGRVLTASSSETFDFNAGGLLDDFGATITFTRLVALIVHAAAGNTNDVVVGNNATNQLVFLGAATHTALVKPGGTLILVAPTAAAIPVVAATGDILKVANGGAGTSVTYDIIAIGS